MRIIIGTRHFSEFAGGQQVFNHQTDIALHDFLAVLHRFIGISIQIDLDAIVLLLNFDILSD